MDHQSATYTDVDGTESNKEIAYKVNAEGPYFLAKSALEIGAKLIHISTDYVFDGTKKNYSDSLSVPRGFMEITAKIL